MNSFWSPLLGKLAAILLFATVSGIWLGAHIGWAVGCAGLVLLLVLHTRNVARLARWLDRPEDREIPDAWGSWGAVYAGLHRLRRHELKKRGEIAAELAMFVQAAEALPDGMALLDKHDQLLWCNHMAQLHLGLRGADDYGLRVTNLVRAPQLAEFIGRVATRESFDHRPPHNPDQLLSIEVIPFGEDRKLLMSFDVTMIERADTTRRDFIANVSHELRTPLTVIHGFLEHMNDGPIADTPEARRHLALMAQQSDRMLKLVDDLLMLSRLEGGDTPPREEWVQMPAVIETLAAEAQALSGGRHAVEAECDDTRLKGSREELRSAFGNLVSNAVRYTPEGGTVRLCWKTDAEGRGTFSVTDSGIGIAPAHIPRLSERFYRVDRGRSRETGGTGLGLAIVKHVLIRHQATLNIESTLGKGSTFSAVFPVWRGTPARVVDDAQAA